MNKLLAGIFAVALLAITADTLLAGQRERTVFVTSASFSGNLGGLKGADEKCQAEADGPGSIVPSGTYRAWLSDETDSPDTRFTKTFDPIVLPDGTKIADGFLDLTHGYIQHPIDIDQTGKRVGLDYFWTGTMADGTAASEIVMCDDWTGQRASGGLAGSTSETDALWSAYKGGAPCSRKYRLVCFQQ